MVSHALLCFRSYSVKSIVRDCVVGILGQSFLPHDSHQGTAAVVINAALSVYKCFNGQPERPDLRSIVDTGLFEACASVVEAVASMELKNQNTDNLALIMALSGLRICSALPECSRRIRSMGKSLAYYLQDDLDLDWIQELGYSSGMVASQVICSTFGREEGGSSGFSFTQHHVDGLIRRWSNIIKAESNGAETKPTPDTIQAVELCVSDTNKPLVLANPEFITYLVDALLLQPDHPRAGLKLELRSWCQAMHTECLAQLAVFPEGKKALLQEPSVSEALKVVADVGLSQDARQHAQSALIALSDTELQAVSEGFPKHVMLSCKWCIH